MEQSFFCITKRFITMFTRTCHWSLSWIKLIQSTHSLFLMGVLLLFCISWSSRCFCRFYNQIFACISPLSHVCHVLFIFELIILIIFGKGRSVRMFYSTEYINIWWQSYWTIFFLPQCLMYAEYMVIIWFSTLKSQ
jgi:hypothetical protein